MKKFSVVRINTELAILYSIGNHTMGVKYPEQDIEGECSLYSSSDVCLSISKTDKSGMLYSVMHKNERLELREASSELVSCDGHSYNLFSGGLILCRDMLGKDICKSVLMINPDSGDTTSTTVLLYSDTIAMTVRYPANDTEYVIRLYTPLMV